MLVLRAMMMLLPAACVADAVVLCAKARGDGTFNATVRIREACQPKGTQLEPAMLGLQGPQGPVGPIGPSAPGGGVRVVDALGSHVGGGLFLPDGRGPYAVVEAPGLQLSALVQWN